MVKLKDRSNMKQYVQDKPIKWGFNFWYRYASKTGYLYQLDLYLGKRSSEENLLPGVVLKTTESFQSCHCMFFFFIISSTFLHLQWSFMKKICMVLAIPKKTGMKCRRYLLTERLREVVLSTCISTNSWTSIQ